MNGYQADLISRPQYAKILEETKNSEAIKVLTGIRRCGKSSLLKILVTELLEEGIPHQNILYKKLDSFDTPLEPDTKWLDDLLQSTLEVVDSHFPIFILLDEVQEVKGWERPIRRLHESSSAHIYLTGSNANLLSSDLATYLSGRYIEIPIFPLSFEEYILFSQKRKPQHSLEKSVELLFADYLRFGGMPGLFGVFELTEEAIERELSAIRDTVLLNDVAKRFKVRDIDLLEKLLRYVYTTSGNLFSSNKVAGALTSMGRKTNAETIDNYLLALKGAFALYECSQIGLKGKSVLQPMRKYYAPDTGLRNLAHGFRMQDIGFQLESVVYMELLRRGFDVHVGALPSGEIDFVAEKLSEKLYIQVCEFLADENTKQREIAPLEAIGDSFPKIIITRDVFATGTTQSGIRIELIYDWLLEAFK